MWGVNFLPATRRQKKHSGRDITPRSLFGRTGRSPVNTGIRSFHDIRRLGNRGLGFDNLTNLS